MVRFSGRLFSILLLPLLLMALGGEKAHPPPLQEQILRPRPSGAPPSKEAGARLEGRVVDAVTGEGLPGALVELPELRRGARCGANGRFRLTAIPPRDESYEVMVRARGYGTKTVAFRFESEAVHVETLSLKPLGY